MTGIYLLLEDNLKENPAIDAYIDVRCGCGRELSSYENRIITKLEQGIPEKDIFNEFNFRTCCRQTLRLPKIISKTNQYYDIDTIEGVHPLTQKPKVADEILYFLRLGWDLLTAAQASPTQEDFQIFSEYALTRPSTLNDVATFRQKYAAKINVSYDDRRDLTPDDYARLLNISGLHRDTFSEIWNYLLRQEQKRSTWRNMRLIKGTPPIPESFRPKKAEGNHMVMVSNTGLTLPLSQPTIPAASSSEGLVYIENYAGPTIYAPDGARRDILPEANISPTLGVAPDEPIDVKPGTSDDFTTPVYTTEGPLGSVMKSFMSQVQQIRGSTRPSTSVSRPRVGIPIPIPTSLRKDRFGQNVGEIREDPVTGFEIQPGVDILHYVNVGGDSKSEKYIVPVISRPIQAR
jgi:hypothetical protein